MSPKSDNRPKAEPIAPTQTEPKVEPKTDNVPEVTPKATKAPKRITEVELVARYPHVIAGSLRYDDAKSKQVVRAKLTCGHEHELATSDLFQVKFCPSCVKAARKDQRKARKAARKAFLATLPK